MEPVTPATCKTMPKFPNHIMQMGSCSNHQQPGLDFDIIYGPVVVEVMIKLFFTPIAVRYLEVEQAGMVTAYLHAFLEKCAIHMRQPTGSEQKWNVCKVLKAHYRLRQSAFLWDEKFDDRIASIGFKRVVEDPCVYQRGDDDDAFLLIYVDDTLLTSATTAGIKRIKSWLGSLFLLEALPAGRRPTIVRGWQPLSDSFVAVRSLSSRYLAILSLSSFLFSSMTWRVVNDLPLKTMPRFDCGRNCVLRLRARSSPLEAGAPAFRCSVHRLVSKRAHGPDGRESAITGRSSSHVSNGNDWIRVLFSRAFYLAQETTLQLAIGLYYTSSKSYRRDATMTC